MLVLSRKAVEDSNGIVIGDSITVKVLQIGTNFIRLGITAPPDVTIVRQELIQRRKEEEDEDMDHDPAC